MDGSRLGVSPVLDAESVVRSSIRRSEIRSFGDLAAFLEVRPGSAAPTTDGLSATRIVLVGISPSGDLFDITPVELSPRTSVNEYGGGAWWPLLRAGRWEAVIVDGKTGHLWAVPVEPGATPTLAACRRMTTDASGGPNIGWADGCSTPDGEFVVAVRERTLAPFGSGFSSIMELAALHVETGQVSILAAGSDFFSSPRISPSGEEIAWISWDLPDMPWHNTVLWRARLQRTGAVLDVEDPAVVVAGDTDGGRRIDSGIAVLDPHWDAGGALWFVSDAVPASDGDRYWNPYCGSVGGRRWVGEYELGRPHWVFGMARYGVAVGGAAADFAGPVLVGGITRDGLDDLVAFGPAAAAPVVLSREINHVGSVTVGSRFVHAIVGGPRMAHAVVRLEIESVLARIANPSAPCTARLLTAGEPTAPTQVALASPVTFAVAPRAVRGGGAPVDCGHGLVYLPERSAGLAEPDAAGRWPLVVMIHGGPTGAAEAQYNPRYQFWTQRGFALLDVNYRGSVGFGRRYRRALDGWWGIADVDDCIAGAQWLVEEGLVDPNRIAIRGSSAGGLTVLNALASSEVFACGVVLYGVADPALLVAETHRFESTYLDSLIAPWPQGAAEYERRSPMAHLDAIAASVLVFQGEEDRVVPLDQAALLVEGLRSQGTPVEYHQFPDEGHGFRDPSVQAFVLQRELEFYQRVFGLDGATPASRPAG